ncbi:DNA-processing protein DprA [Mycobacteroides abscessus]
MERDYTRRTAVVMAALELLPAQASDLTGIVRDPEQFTALLDPYGEHPNVVDLVTYLRENIDPGRIDHWHKLIDRLIVSQIAMPVLASDCNPEDWAYPTLLTRCWDAPPILFTTAEIDTGGHVAAIVGSRSADIHAQRAAHELAAYLAARGITVVSGLAAGIDAAAHHGALAVGGRTIAVMGTGITRIYPEQNTTLANQIKTGSGALVSQFAPYAPRTRTSFLHRNHVIAGLSHVSVIMAGESRSGSRHEIEQALNYGRLVLMWEPALAQHDWAQRLAADGQAFFVNSPGQVCEHLDRVGH